MSTRSTALACLAVMTTMAGTSAWGQDVTFADLDGHVIDATIVRDMVVRREGRQGPAKVTQVWKIVVGPDDSIETTITPTAQTPRGERKGRPRTGTLFLGKAEQIPSQGGGTALWEFNDGTLTFARTWKQGAYKSNFAFARGTEGLTCKVTETFGREAGRGIVMESPIDGAPITVISSKQVSSNCQVVKP